MDLRYNAYVTTKRKYFYPPTKLVKENMLEIPQFPQGWVTELDSNMFWRYCNKYGVLYPKQGWKIHISTKYENCQHTLDIVSSILIKDSVCFKYVASKWELVNQNAKYANRGSSGKFITIYPANEKQFLSLLNELHEALKDEPKGPYILNDKRWLDGNVYFRYGAFVEMFTYEHGEKKHAIRDIQGEYIEDYRGPSYKKPDFISEPLEVQQMEAEMEAIGDSDTELERYEIESALHFSNGGGVYKAIDKSAGTEVVIKEGRPGAGLDGEKRDAVARILHEAKILECLSELNNVVKYIRTFKAWEHQYFVEEYIDGGTLNTWIAIQYPFVKGKNFVDYSQKALVILNNLKMAMLEVHKRDIGIGDLQITNIMVLEDLTVKLIDFEAGGALKSEEPIGLATPGFASPYVKTREEADWFALLRIARYLFLPIGPVQDISEGIIDKHDIWIEKYFGAEVLSTIRKIESECNSVFPAYKKHKIQRYYKKFYGKDDIPLIIQGLRNGMISDMKLTKQLLPGDIRQYLKKDSMFDVLTGGFGVIMALNRTGSLPEVAKKWAIEYCQEKHIEGIGNGLFTGKAGIAAVVYDLGYVEQAKKIYDSIQVDLDMQDISLMSGLSGIGLAFIAASLLPGLSYFLDKAILIAERIERLESENIVLTALDVESVMMGVMDGWSAASLFFSILYKVTKNCKWIELSKRTLQRDIEHCQFDEYGTLQILDDKRLLPYLFGGSAGIAIAIREYRIVSQDINIWDKELLGIETLAETTCTYNGGLLWGFTSFIVLANSLEKKQNDKRVDELVEGVNLYLIEKNDKKFFYPGNTCYRLSGDVFSGSSGVILALQDIMNGRWDSWMPLPIDAKKNLF